MLCIECGSKLNGKAKFCGSCGKPVSNINAKEVPSTFNNIEPNEWVSIGRQYKFYSELSKNKSPEAKAAARTFYKMLWGQKIIRQMTYILIVAVAGFSSIGVVSELGESKSKKSYSNNSADKASSIDATPSSGGASGASDSKSNKSSSGSAADQASTTDLIPASGEVCSKITGLTQGYGEALAYKYKTSALKFSLLRVDKLSDGSCILVVDTPEGVKKCWPGSIVQTNGKFLAHDQVKIPDGYVSMKGSGLCD